MLPAQACERRRSVSTSPSTWLNTSAPQYYQSLRKSFAAAQVQKHTGVSSLWRVARAFRTLRSPLELRPTRHWDRGPAGLDLANLSGQVLART